jgi:RNA polymerase sigma factor (sigma-70 family)
LNTQELIRLCLLGNPEGQRLLYERFVTQMVRLCLRYIKDKAEAQDVLIEGFTKVYAMLKRFEYRDEHSLEAWIKKIMINQCLMSLRRKKMVITMDYTDTELQISRTENTELSAEEIVGLIQTLPEGYRTIFSLYVVDGYSHKEIAASLGISESASRSQLTHARNKLQQLLRTHGWK